MGLDMLSVSDKEGVAEPLGLGVSFGRNGHDVFEITPHGFCEGFIFVGGPENDAAAGAERLRNHAEAFLGVESGVAFLDKWVGAVIDIEEDRIVGAGPVFADNFEDITLIDDSAGIIKEASVDRLKVFTIPLHDDRKKFGDFYDGFLWDELEDAAEGETKTETADKDARIFFEVGTGEFRHRLLREALRGAHKRDTIDLKEVVAIMLLKEQRFAIRSPSGGEICGWFHRD